MGYGTEFKSNWRYLLAATVGMGLGLSSTQYTMSLFAPELLAEFGWSKAKYALIGSSTFLSMLFIPFAGRFTDRVGPRTAAMVGFIALPLGYLALSLMQGSFAVYFAVTVLKSVFGSLTTSMVFARVAVERFDGARGLALSILMTGSPAAGAIAAPLIAEIIEHMGWRAGFQALGLLSFFGGVIVVALLGKTAKARTPKRSEPFSRAQFAGLFRSPLLPLTIGGMLLVNVPQGMVSTQLKLVLQESHAPAQLITGLISLYAIGVVIGRIITGLALDRIQPHRIAIAMLGVPALSLLALASPFDSPWILVGAVLLVGLAQGAEGDIGAYLISRKFELGNYSLLLSLLSISITLGAATGSLFLSYTLHLMGDYNAFLLFSAAATLCGALLFFLTGRLPRVSAPAAEAVPSA